MSDKLYRLGLWVGLREKVDFFDDVEQGLGTTSFVGDGFGSVVGRGDECFVVGRAEQEQVGVEFFLRADIELVDKRSQFAERFELDAVEIT